MYRRVLLEAYGWGCRMHRRQTDRSYRIIRWRERDTENGAESAERNEERGEMRNICRRGEGLGLSLCAVPSPCRIRGLSIYGRAEVTE